MTLTTHIIIAAAAAQPFAEFHPAVIFTVALASHYLSDAIPHWDYSILSFPDKSMDDVHKRRWNFGIRTFWIDILRIGTDFFIGSTILWLILRPAIPAEWLTVLLIFAGGALPDFLQGVYYTRHADFLKPLHVFHDFMHTKIKLGPYPWIGVPFQVLIFSLVLYFLL